MFKPLKINLQLFAGDEPQDDLDYDVDSLEDMLGENVGNDDDGDHDHADDDDASTDDDTSTDDDDVSDEPSDEKDGDESDEDDKDGDDDTDDDEPQDDDDVDLSDVKFDKKQQAKVNEIVQNRLTRAEQKWEKMIQEAAGTELDMENGGEVLSAVRLWGLLKTNPELSRAIDTTIQHYLSNGMAKQPEFKQATTKEQELELKEAIIDMKLADSTFAKNHTKIMEWAEDQGFVITDKKSLEMAYLAWKGSNARKEAANAQLREQRKSQKKGEKKKAVLESGRKRSKKPVDYRKMTDRDILAYEGLKLFTED